MNEQRANNLKRDLLVCRPESATYTTSRKRIKVEQFSNDDDVVVKSPCSSINSSTTIIVGVGDVLCGRGGYANNHPGNVVFRTLVQENTIGYMNCLKRSHKQLYAKSIVKAICSLQDPPGRFLEFNKKQNTWEQIDEKRAIRKTNRSLREESVFLTMKSKEAASSTNKLAAAEEVATKSFHKPSCSSPTFVVSDCSNASHKEKEKANIPCHGGVVTYSPCCNKIFSPTITQATPSPSPSPSPAAACMMPWYGIDCDDNKSISSTTEDDESSSSSSSSSQGLTTEEEDDSIVGDDDTFRLPTTKLFEEKKEEDVSSSSKGCDVLFDFAKMWTTEEVHSEESKESVLLDDDNMFHNILDDDDNNNVLIHGDDDDLLNKILETVVGE